MAVQPAVPTSRSAAETLKSGIEIVTITETYDVMSDSRDENQFNVLNAPGVPKKRDNTYHGTNICFCITRSATRPGILATALKWQVVVTYTNDSTKFAHNDEGVPVSDPAQAAKVVDVDYMKEERPTTKAKFRSVTIGPYNESLLANGDPDPDKLLSPPTWLPRVVGPVVNSAGDPRYSTNPRYFRRVVVSRILRNWDDTISDYQGAINDDEVVIVERDGAGAAGIRATHTFPKFTLRVDDIVKKNLRLGNKLYYHSQIVLVENLDTWVHSEADVGQRQRLFVGQTKDTSGDTYSVSDLAALSPPIGEFDYDHRNIVKDEVAIGDPAKLNGFGMPLPIVRDPGATAAIQDGDTIYVNFDIDDIKDFSVLAL